MPRTSVSPAPIASPTLILERLAFLAAAILVVVVPLIWDSQSLEAFRNPKSTLALVAWGILAAVFLVSNMHGEGWRDPWWFAWGGVLLGGLASVPLSDQPLRVLSAVAPLVVTALGWGAARQMTAERQARLMRWMVVVGVVEGVMVLVFLNPEWRPQSFQLLEQSVRRVTWIGTLGNAGDVALFLMLPALIAFSLALQKGRIVRVLWLLAAAFMAAIVLGTQTLSVTAGLALGLALVLWTKVPRQWRAWAIAVFGVLALAVALLTPVGARVRGAVVSAGRGDWIWLGSGRGAGFAAAGAMVEAHPLTGVGLGLYGAKSYRFQDEKTLAERGRELGMVTGFGEAHNDPLQFAAETGLVGLALAALGFVLAWRRKSADPGVLPVRLPLLAAAVLVSLAQFPLHIAAVASQWAVLFAFALPVLPGSLPRLLGGWARVIVAAPLVICTALLGWGRHAAAVAVRQAEVLSWTMRQKGSSAPRRDLASAALTKLEPRLRWFPFSHQAQVVAGNLAIDAGKNQLGLRYFSRALALDERPEIRFDVGVALLLVGERQAGLAHLVQAVKLNPATLRRVTDAELANSLRLVLDADGYGKRYPWIYRNTPAEKP